MKNAAEAAHFFLPDNDIQTIDPFGSGNVNDTYIVTVSSGDKRILQRLNPEVFPDSVLVVRNMVIVLKHLHREHDNNNALSDGFGFVTLYQGKTGDHYIDADGSVWRLMSMIGNCLTCNHVSRQEEAEELGRGLGIFHRLLSTLDIDKLEDTLPGFHDTPQYLARYDSISNDMDLSGDDRSVFCASVINRRRDLAHCLEDEKKLSQGIIHGDPKVANFLFDKDRGRVISLIDLDTVKPGLLLHDLGDALRSSCNPAGERAEKNDRVQFDHIFFEAWLRGYLNEAGYLLSDSDKKNIVNAVMLISFELGIRFFTDYLEGNRYFKVHEPDENLYRAIVQFKLVGSIEEKADRLQQIVNTF